QTTALLDPFAHLRAWMERIDAFGHGQITEIEGKEAVEVARKATPQTETRVDPAEPNGLKAGDRVAVVREGFERDPGDGGVVATRWVGSWWPPRYTRSRSAVAMSARGRWWCTSRASTTWCDGSERSPGSPTCRGCGPHRDARPDHSAHGADLPPEVPLFLRF